LEAQGGIEPPMKVLQTFALPLGYCALVPAGIVKSLLVILIQNDAC
jgi:hypothetical protein